MCEELEDRRVARAVAPLAPGVGFCSAGLCVYGGERAGVCLGLELRLPCVHAACPALSSTNSGMVNRHFSCLFFIFFLFLF